MPYTSRGHRLLMELRARGVRPARAEFPDLSVDRQPAPLSNGFGKTVGKRELPADAKYFPVGHCHKQGTQLITPDQIKSELQWMGGRKS